MTVLKFPSSVQMFVTCGCVEEGGKVPTFCQFASWVDITYTHRNWAVTPKFAPPKEREIYTTSYLEPICPVFWGLNPSKECFFQSKQGSLGFQVIISYHYQQTWSLHSRCEVSPDTAPQKKELPELILNTI